MNELAALRQALATFLGEATFQKFVEQGYRRNRWRVWQEELLARFLAAHPQFAADVPDFQLTLQVCELHNCKLLLEMVEIRRSHVDVDDSYVDARNRFFPRAATGRGSGKSLQLSGKRRDVRYCPKCRDAEAAWREGKLTSVIAPLWSNEYNEMEVLAWYAWEHFQPLLTEFERRAYFAGMLQWKAAEVTPRDPSCSEGYSVRLGPVDDPEIEAALADGVDALRQRIVHRLLADQDVQARINRCPNCGKVVCSPLAGQCRWCGHDWHCVTK